MQKTKNIHGSLRFKQSLVSDFQPNLSSCFYSEIRQKKIRKTNIFHCIIRKSSRKKNYLCLWKPQTCMLISTFAGLNATTSINQYYRKHSWRCSCIHLRKCKVVPLIPSQDFIEAAYIQLPRCISGTITLNYCEKLEITDELDCHQTSLDNIMVAK